MLNVNLGDVMPLGNVNMRGSMLSRVQRYCKSKTIQNKKGTFFIFIVEMQRTLSKGTAKFRQYQKKSQQSFTDCWDFYKLLMIYAFTATEIQSKTNEQIPNATIPTVQIASANLVEHALWKVGSGLSLCLMNIAFTMSR